MSRRFASAHPCPTPSKQVFESVDDAREAYERNLVNPVMIGMQIADYAYRCQCGKFHRTHRHDHYLGGVALG